MPRGWWVRDLDSMTARPLQGTEGGFFPFWSPDGASIGFQTPTHLKRVPLEGGSVRTLCENDFSNGATWSTAEVVIFAALTGLFRVSAEGGIPEPLTTVDEGAFPMSRSRAHTHRRHGHPLQTVPSAGLIERPPEKNRVDALR